MPRSRTMLIAFLVVTAANLLRFRLGRGDGITMSIQEKTDSSSSSCRKLSRPNRRTVWSTRLKLNP